MAIPAPVLPPVNCLALCAGVGGLDLAIRLAVPQTRAICYVEREASAAAALVASMESGRLHPAPVWSDLSTFDARPWRGIVDIVTSGDPCQPNSVAGKRGGADDDRFLIDQVLRIVEECRPLRLFRENVPGNADGQLAALVPALEAMGYRVAAGIFSSAETGNSHRRERLFIMADCTGGRSREAGRFQWGRSDEWSARCGAAMGDAPSARRGTGKPGESGPLRDAPRGQGFDGSGERMAFTQIVGHERPRSARGRRGGLANSGDKLALTNGARLPRGGGKR